MAEKKHYAEIKWSIEDVRTMFAGASDDELHDWFARNEKHLRDRLVELGWGVMDTLLSMDPPKREQCERCGSTPAEERGDEILCADCGMAQEAGELEDGDGSSRTDD